MNRSPVIKNGTIIIIEPVLPECMKKIILPAMADRMKTIPPIVSHFQEIIRIVVRIRAGILCIRKPISFLPSGSFPPNTSNENIVINRIAIIVKILGIQ